MEDAHIAKLNFDNNPDFHLFGVFDGHGGYYCNSQLSLERKGSCGVLLGEL